MRETYRRVGGEDRVDGAALLINSKGKATDQPDIDERITRIHNDRNLGKERGHTEHSGAIDQQFTGRQQVRKADRLWRKAIGLLLPLNVAYPARGQIDR
jgi:hypothetical protein